MVAVAGLPASAWQQSTGWPRQQTLLLQQQQQVQGVLMLQWLERQRRLRRLVKGLQVAAGQVGGGRALGPQRGGGSGCGSAGQQNPTLPGM
jgi:hypothetical protein